MVVPEIVPGVGGVAESTVTVKFLDILMPHELAAVTVIVPLSPAAPVVTSIELVVAPKVMLHPVGTVQL